MKTTLLKMALNPTELSEIGEMLLDPAFPTRAALVDPFQDMVNQLETTWCSAALYHNDAGCDQHYHIVAMLDENGVTHTVDDAQTMFSSIAGAPRPTIYDTALIEKGTRYDKLLSALGTHKLRLFSADMSDSLDTESELLELLQTFAAVS